MIVESGLAGAMNNIIEILNFLAFLYNKLSAISAYHVHIVILLGRILAQKGRYTCAKICARC